VIVYFTERFGPVGWRGRSDGGERTGPCPIRALAGGARDFPFGLVRNPIRMMSLDHDRAGDLLAGLRAATDGYRVPDDGCASYPSLYERLERLETDTHRHIHLENNVLFHAAMAVEDA
jgi:hypothetical protein